MALSSSITALTVPASVTVPAGATSATFTAAAGAIASSQSATLTAALNGSSATAAIALVLQPTVSSLSCSPTSFTAAKQSSSCTVTVANVSGVVTISLSSDNVALVVPASFVGLPGSSASANFTVSSGTFTTNQTAHLTASLNGSSQIVTFSLTITTKAKGSSKAASMALPSAATDVTALQCRHTKFTGANQFSVCQVSVSNPGSAVSISISSDNAALWVPSPTVAVAGTSNSARFSVLSRSFTASQTAHLTATLNGSSQSITYSLVPSTSQTDSGTAKQAVNSNLLTGAALCCTPQYLQAGDTSECDLRLGSGGASAPVELAIASSSGQLQIPATVRLRTGQVEARFEVTAAAEAGPETVALRAGLGGTQTETTLGISASAAPVLVTPGTQTGKPGAPIAFAIRAAQGNDTPITLTASDLPAGANFDPITGAFEWVPGEQDLGQHALHFAAVNPAGVATARMLQIDVESGLPEIWGLRNAAGASAPAACTPGSVASLVGAFLANGNQARVLINGDDAIVTETTPESVDFLCPEADPGAALSISVETAGGSSTPLVTAMRDLAPGILTLPATKNQALAYIEESLQIPAIPNFEVGGQPAQPGDVLSVLMSGIRCDGEVPSQTVLVNFGSGSSVIGSIQPEYEGICRIQATVPAGLPAGRIPLTVQVTGNNGTPVTSNTAFIAVGN